MNDNNEQKYEDFISTVSHELRTPLTSIRGFSQTLLSSWDKLDDDSKKKFIGIIETQSNRLINLVENMLSVSKLQANGNNIYYQEVSVKPIIEQTVTIVKNQYKSHSFAININNSFPNIFVDKGKFQQIITNLIENSAKYSPDNTTTEINTKIYDNSAIIEVSNLGLHIDEKDYETIFTKFARIDNPLTRKVQGSGLGLYITKTLVEKMQGTISVKSKKADNKYDKITFTIKFPLHNLEEEARLKCNQ